jgi:dTDP-4-amino-4,6-dideoxygalactose transaminase
MTERIYLSSPDVTGLEEAALVRAVRSGWIAPLGPEVDAFEEELAAFCGRKHCVALSSGTAALHLGLLTLDIGRGDIVVTSSMTFAATANAIVYTGAEPVFVDSDETGNMDPDLLAEALVDLERKGTPAKAVLPVDLLGKVADHGRIDAIAAQHGLPVLSDAAESLGAARDGRPAASYGVAAVLSFNGNKIMTTSGGGALLTDDEAFGERVRYLSTQSRQPVIHYEHTEVGYNYRLSNILAALGRAQLERLPDMMERRRRHRLAYADLFKDVPGVAMFGEPSGAEPRPRSQTTPPPTHDNWWLASVLADPNAAPFTAEDLRSALAESNIEARPLWKPMHLQPVYQDKKVYSNGTSARLFSTGLSLPSGSVLDDARFGRVRDEILRFLEDHR